MTAGGTWLPGHNSPPWTEEAKRELRERYEAEHKEENERLEAERREAKEREERRRAALTPEERAVEDAERAKERAESDAWMERYRQREDTPEFKWTWDMYLEEAAVQVNRAWSRVQTATERGEVVLVPDHMADWLNRLVRAAIRVDKALEEQHGPVVPFRRVANKRRRPGGRPGA